MADVAYNLKMLLTQKFKPMNFVLFYQIFETFSLPALLPWVLFSLIIQSKLVITEDPIIPSDKMAIFFNIMSIGSGFGYILHEIFKRRSNDIIYKQENESLLRIAEYLILFIVNLFLISVPTFTIAAFMTLFGKR